MGIPVPVLSKTDSCVRYYYIYQRYLTVQMKKILEIGCKCDTLKNCRIRYRIVPIWLNFRVGFKSGQCNLFQIHNTGFDYCFANAEKFTFPQKFL
jgi:hypothetical protein